MTEVTQQKTAGEICPHCGRSLVVTSTKVTVNETLHGSIYGKVVVSVEVIGRIPLIILNILLKFFGGKQ